MMKQTTPMMHHFLNKINRMRSKSRILFGTLFISISIVLIMKSIAFYLNLCKYSPEIMETTNYDLNDISKAAAERRFVIISTDFSRTSMFYAFHLPISILAWRRIGYEPIIMFISSDLQKTNPLGQLVLKYLKMLKVKEVYVHSPPNYEKMVSMIARCFVGLLSSEQYEIHDEDFILTTDTDIIPIDKSFYTFENIDAIKVLNAFCCGTFGFANKTYPMYPLLHIGMKKRMWREVMELNSSDYKLDGESILKKLERVYGPSYIKQNDQIVRGDDTWYTDQKTISMAIVKYATDLKKAPLDLLPYKGSRLDRSLTPFQWNLLLHFFQIFTDCHSFQKDVFDKWGLLQRLFKKIFSENKQMFLNNFYIDYLAAMKNYVF